MTTVFITGNTEGIGLAITQHLENLGYTVSGGSRRTGHDIGDNSWWDSILEYDVFINNAASGNNQLNLLEYVYRYWKDTPKTIINIGSAHKDIRKGRPLKRSMYNAQKKALEAYSFWIAENDGACKSMMYNPGEVDTLMSRAGAADWPDKEQQNRLNRLMPVEECARAIEFMLRSPCTVKELTHI